ncbi:hypothetical protein ACLOJK_003548 [Asimina triloba]
MAVCCSNNRSHYTKAQQRRGRLWHNIQRNFIRQSNNALKKSKMIDENQIQQLINENPPFDILEMRIIYEEIIEQLLAVAEVAKRYLRIKVIKDLRWNSSRAGGIKESKEETESMLGCEQDLYVESSTCAGYNSLSSYAVLDIEMPW